MVAEEEADHDEGTLRLRLASGLLRVGEVRSDVTGVVVVVVVAEVPWSGRKCFPP